jgi:hypothetical protein
MKKLLLFMFFLGTSLFISAQCNIIYVTPTGTSVGSGTQADPLDIATAFGVAGDGDVVRLSTGTYNLNTPLTIPANNVIIEGGFIAAESWKKTSLQGATTLVRTATNPEGATNSQRLVAMYADGLIRFELHDLTITTQNSTLAGCSSYGLHINNCADYKIVRCKIVAGNGAAGSAGTPGVAGTTGANGTQGQSGSCDGGDCTFNTDDAGGAGGNGGSGGGGASGGNGGPAINDQTNPGLAGQAGTGRNGGAGGGGGAGGDECTSNSGTGGAGGASACVNGPNGGVGGNGGDPGVDGSNGSNGTAGSSGTSGTPGAPGGVTGLFWLPGASGGNGTDGCGGSGGSGGGGGGRQTCTLCDNGPGNGGSGGGGGGQGGTGGQGGKGGGASIGVFVINNGANAEIIQSQILSGSAGNGGLGGAGGSGGSGGAGASRNTTCSSEIGEGGAGGNGGAGGAGGAGGNGATGASLALYFVSGTALVASETSFDLQSQPVIKVDYETCTNSNINFEAVGIAQGAATADWNFGAYANPTTATSTANPATTSYTSIGWNTIQQGTDVYSDFVYISCEGYSQTITPVVCAGGSVTVGTSTYNVSGTYTDVFTSVMTGCDSTVTTILTVMQPLDTVITETACFSYTLNGQTYNSSGTYLQNLTGTNNCDSTITLNLTINNVDIAASVSAATLTANASGAQYQWIDCDNGNTPIPGAQAQIYVATANGNYAVVVTQNGCSDTSDCLNVNQVGLDEKPSGTFITVYPNPTNGDLTVKMPAVKGRTDLEVTDLSGKVIYKRSNIKESQWNFTLKAPAGVYFVKVTSDENVFLERVIKE